MTARVPELAAEGLCFRPWRDTDAPAVLELARDPSAWQWMASLRAVDDLAGALRWVRGRHEDGRFDWVVCEPAGETIVGRVGLHHLDELCRSAEVGYAVWPRHRGRGLAAVMVARAAEHAFRGLGLARVSLKHATGNPASCAVAGRAGFAFEGLERSAHDHGDGVLHDLHRHARLAGDPPGPVEAPALPLDVPVLDGDGLRLRPWRDDDVPAYLRGVAHPTAARWSPHPPPRTVHDGQRWLERVRRRALDGQALHWAVEEAGVVAGSVGLRSINRIDQWATASYWVLPEARGHRVAPRALRLATTYAFEVLRLHRVQLQHAVGNTASCRVADKAGFALEGIQRGSCLLADGFVDEHLHARLAGDP